LACGAPIRASDLFADAADPARALGDLAWQWRAAVPEELWIDAIGSVAVRREWTADDRRDLVLTVSDNDDTENVEPFWAHNFDPSWEFRTADPGSSFSNYFQLGPGLKSAHLCGTTAEDSLRHTLDPLLRALPDTVTTFVIHGRDDTESVAHGLIQLVLALRMHDDPERLLAIYERLARAVAATWNPPGVPDRSVGQVTTILLRTLTIDAHRLGSADLLHLVRTIHSSPAYQPGEHLLLALDCLLADPTPLVDERDLFIDELLHDLPPWIADLQPQNCLRLLLTLSPHLVSRRETSPGSDRRAARQQPIPRPSPKRVRPGLAAGTRSQPRRLPGPDRCLAPDPCATTYVAADYGRAEDRTAPTAEVTGRPRT
jgi:hypothetical protein